MKDLLLNSLQPYQLGGRYVVHEGGSRSGKTFSLLTALYIIADTTPDILISVVSETFPHLRRGAIRDFQNILVKGNLWDEMRWSKTESLYRFNNGSVIEFFSVDSPGKVHGPARDILFINEAQNISYDIARHLFVRTTGTIFIDFNPTHEFWAHTELKDDPGTTWVHSTYKDNPFLSAEQVKEIERNRKNENWWRVYGEGLIGQMEGLVFPEWQYCDKVPEGSTVWGMDFGFTNDPTAIVEVTNAGGAWYVRELEYSTGMVNRDIVNALQAEGITGTVYADSASPKDIEEIYRSGVDIRPADKGSDSVMSGINFIKSQPLFIHKDSVNLVRELRNYTFDTDKEGKALNKPIDRYNHAIDAMRYAIYTAWRPKPTEQTFITKAKRQYR